MKANKLKGRIVECGYSVPSMAREIGISRQALYTKMRGVRQFRADEIARLTEILHLTSAEAWDIFFTEGVPNTVHDHAHS